MCIQKKDLKPKEKEFTSKHWLPANKLRKRKNCIGNDCVPSINKTPKDNKGSHPVSLTISPDIFINITLSQHLAHGFIQEQKDQHE